MNDNRWASKHRDYSKQDWATKPSIFAEQVLEYFPKQAKILEIGAGHGQDSLFFAAQGFTVMSTDLETSSLEENIANADQETKKQISAQKLDISNPFTFNEKFDAIYAHLSLHYFDEKTTKRIFEDIYNSLNPNGVLAFLTNSVDDPEYNTGTKLEEHYFEIEGAAKRYFDVDEAKRFTHKFNPLLLDNNGETYKDAAKGIHHLIRFIGQRQQK